MQFGCKKSGEKVGGGGEAKERGQQYEIKKEQKKEERKEGRKKKNKKQVKEQKNSIRS